MIVIVWELLHEVEITSGVGSGYVLGIELVVATAPPFHFVRTLSPPLGKFLVGDE